MGKKSSCFGILRTRVLAIGAGASGLAAAIAAARAGASVCAADHQNQAGKKILITGNGRCNLGNTFLTEDCWRGSHPEFLRGIPGIFDARNTTGFFERLGIVIRRDGTWCYPASGQASTVRDVLLRELQASGAKLLTGCGVEGIRVLSGAAGREESPAPFGMGTPEAANGKAEPGEDQPRFAVHTNLGEILADAVILAAGSQAAPDTGSDGSGYALAASLGHPIVKPLPALVQLRCREEAILSGWAGIRFHGRVTLEISERDNLSGDHPGSGTDGASGNLSPSDEGEIQLTGYGISGIPVFQVSRFAARALDAGRSVRARLNFWPDEGVEDIRARLLARRRDLGDCYSSELLIGWFHRKIGDTLLSLAGIPRNIRISEVTDRMLDTLVPEITSFPLTVTGTNSFAQAQTCSGGVDTAEVDPETMASGLVPGLYFAGEILDVDGICGGYNLHFAWRTGEIAGEAAARF
ncbi:aminoacetone oxidase family FAD-binding enzyme [Clostridium vitabionis]|uniref:aminoacetone oxidase family FAD-binding enzyme n=1 Tax=Clostridium vitabionis TaxID=2784388 RepID=UPI00188A7E1F|nr:aminoacetone oxidase family FAD-binding enzyme [Clostridium vitabionis]